MPAETGDEALEAELRTEVLLDEVDVHAAAAYEAGVWRELPLRAAALRGERRSGHGWGWCAFYGFAEAEERHVWSWRLRAGAACCI